MSYGREKLPAVESPSVLPSIEPTVPFAGEDFGSNDLQQQMLLAQVVTTDGVKKPKPQPAPQPSPQPRPAPRPGGGPIRRA